MKLRSAGVHLRCNLVQIHDIQLNGLSVGCVRFDRVVESRLSSEAPSLYSRSYFALKYYYQDSSRQDLPFGHLALVHVYFHPVGHQSNPVEQQKHRMHRLGLAEVAHWHLLLLTSI